jgi:hypothetical protein
MPAHLGHIIVDYCIMCKDGNLPKRELGRLLKRLVVDYYEPCDCLPFLSSASTEHGVAKDHGFTPPSICISGKEWYSSA